MEYFKWRLDEPEKFFGFNLPNNECELCLKLSEPKLRKGKKFANGKNEFKKRMTVKSVHGWVYDEEDAECLV